VQTTSLNSRRDFWHISIEYSGLKALRLALAGAVLPLALGLTLVASSGAVLAQTAAETTTEAKPKGKSRYDPEAVKHYNHALELHNSGFLNKAVEEYKAALKVDERLEPAYSNLGLIFIAQKNMPKAQESFEKALAIKPNSPKSLNGMASVLYAQKKMQPAIDTWKKAIQFDPKFAPAYFNMGTALEALENFGEAMDAYVKAVSINPKMADAYYRMGLLEKKLNHPAQGKVLLQHAVTMEPEAEWARDARKQIELLMEKWAKDPTSTDITTEVHRVSKNSPSLAEKGNSPDSSKETGRETGKETGPESESTTANTTNSSNEGATTSDTDSGKLTDKDKEGGEKKRRSPFKRKIRPSNNEERAKSSGTEMKMFIKAPEETDLQAKPQ